MSMVSVVRTTGRTFGLQMFLYTTDKRQLRIHKSQILGCLRLGNVYSKHATKQREPFTNNKEPSSGKVRNNGMDGAQNIGIKSHW
jgi:hypothetical protein